MLCQLPFLTVRMLFGSRAQDVVYGTAVRLYGKILPLGRENRGANVARRPWAVDETKQRRATRFRYDVAIFIKRLQQEGSLACRIYSHFGMNRPIMGMIFKSLQRKRAAQVSLIS